MHIDLKSDFELPANAWSFRKEIGDMTIITEAVCMGHARKVCSEIEEALKHGAPIAQVFMLEKINEANRTGTALSCRLELNN